MSNEPRFTDIVEFRDCVIAAFERQPGFVSAETSPEDPAKFDWQLGDLTGTSDVTNIFGYLNSYPEEGADEIIERFARSASNAAMADAGDQDLVAAVRTVAAIEELKAQGLQPIYRPLVGGLAVTLMVDSPTSLGWAVADNFPRRSVESLEPIALENLRSWLPKVIVDRPTDKLVQYIVDGNESLSPGLILLDEFWEQVGSDFPGDVFVTLARRDQLFLLDAANPSNLGLARRLIDLTFEDGFALLSDRIYRWRNGSLELVEE